MNSIVRKMNAGLMLTAKSAKLFSVFKLLKFSKPIITALSLCVSAVAYGAAYGPLFGISLVGVLMVHEMGHIAALRQRGIITPGPVFIPFLGAAIFIPKMDCRETEAWVGIGGPAVGMSLAILCLGLYYLTGWGILLPITYLGVILNLFNLLPVSPLDGGRILQVLGTWPKYVGGVLLIAYTLYTRDPGLCIIWVLILDAFRLPRYWAYKIAIFLWVSMCSLFLLGYGVEPYWNKIVDATLITLLISILWARDSKTWEAVTRDWEAPRLLPSNAVKQSYTLGYLAILGTGVLLINLIHIPS